MKIMSFSGLNVNNYALDENLSKGISFNMSSIQTKTVYHNSSESIQRFYEPPSGISYHDNESVFGRILDGSLPCCPIVETDELLAFYDKYPKADFHALVIPKRYIPTVKHLHPDFHRSIIEQMHHLAFDIIRQKLPPSVTENMDYRLVYHIPPFNSVNHLHLHILAPSSKMNPLFRNVKYQTNTFWCIEAEKVLDTLKSGKSL